MNEREIKGVGIIVGLGLVGMAILNGVYRAGFSAGLAQSGQGGASVSVHPGYGFFPFPPILLIIGGIFLFVMWRRRWSGNGSGPAAHGPGGGRPPRLFEEWHRRAHDAGDAEEATADREPVSTHHSSETRIV